MSSVIYFSKKSHKILVNYNLLTMIYILNRKNKKIMATMMQDHFPLKHYYIIIFILKYILNIYITTSEACINNLLSLKYN